MPVSNTPAKNGLTDQKELAARLRTFRLEHDLTWEELHTKLQAELTKKNRILSLATLYRLLAGETLSERVARRIERAFDEVRRAH